MSKGQEFGCKLADQLERMGIIQEGDQADFWLNVILWKVREETGSIFESFVDYIKSLPNLDLAKQGEAETYLKELANLFDEIKDELDREKTLSNSDRKFKVAVEGMHQLLIAFQLGRYQWENPVAEINQAYDAGRQYAQINQLEEETNAS